MVKLFQFPPHWNLPNASPFCMKIETYLRMAEIPYQIVKIYDPRKAPKGKLPFIEDKGKCIADSSLIIDYLKANYGDKLDCHLDSAKQAEGLALQRLIEEHLYWTIFYARWFDPQYWPLTKDEFFRGMPLITRAIIVAMIRKKMYRDFVGHGLGRHSEDEIYAFGVSDLTALATILQKQPFLLGESPSSIDASGYAFLANILQPPIESPLKNYAKSQACFTQYCVRMKTRYYS